MIDITLHIFGFLETILFIIIILFALIYSLPIICIRRFHQHNNVLTLNICLATILCCFSWLIMNAAIAFDNLDEVSKISGILQIAQIIFTVQIPLSFVVVALHRYCSIVYHTNIFFKTKQWIMLCIGSQWMIGIILSIPNLVCVDKVRLFFCVDNN
jgi:hypothetical protein